MEQFPDKNKDNKVEIEFGDGNEVLVPKNIVENPEIKINQEINNKKKTFDFGDRFFDNN